MADTSQNSTTAAAAKYWDSQMSANKAYRLRWWDDRTTLQHINRLVIGRPIDGIHAGFHDCIGKFSGGRMDRAISVGCGVAAKEMDLVKKGFVGHFDFFEISPASIERGKHIAELNGITSQLAFNQGGFEDAPMTGDYDLVYWNNALHHMPDVVESLVWSKKQLRAGGLFAMDDFVGPTRFQWTEENLRWANLVLATLSDRYLQSPHVPGTLVARQVGRPSPEYVAALDPSEAADSGRILDAMKVVFPDATIIPTGGALYHLALNDLFCNFVTEDDLCVLNQILLLDGLLAEKGTTHYAVAFARK